MFRLIQLEIVPDVPTRKVILGLINIFPEWQEVEWISVNSWNFEWIDAKNVEAGIFDWKTLLLVKRRCYLNLFIEFQEVNGKKI